MNHRYTAVTVVYEGDLPLLRLQARSMALYVASGVLDAVVVIDNTRRGLSSATVRRLVSSYGPLAGLTTVVRAHRIVDREVAAGWFGQQLLKILVAGSVSTDRYLLLDAKNVFVNPLVRDFLEAPDGRPRMRVQGYATHPLLPNLQASLRWWGVDPGPYAPSFGSTITPFVMDTALVRQMVEEVEERSGTTFARAFLGQDVTEFFFWMGWLVSRGRLDEVYDLDRVRCPALWARNAGVAMLQKEIDEADRDGPPVFTVHQRALALFDPERTSLLAAYWTRSGLFASPEEAAAFIAGFQRTWRWLAIRTRARARVLHLPVRVLRRVRRAAQR